MTEKEEEKKKEVLPQRSIMNPFASTTAPTPSASSQTGVHRINPFNAPSSATTSTNAAANQPIDNVNKFFSTAFSSFRLPQQQQDTSKSPVGAGGNVFSQFLPPPKATVDNATTTTTTMERNEEKQVTKEELDKKEDKVTSEEVNASSSTNGTTTEPEAVIESSSETKPDEAAAAALIQELAMESPSPSPVDIKTDRPKIAEETKSSGAIPIMNPFDIIKSPSQTSTQVQQDATQLPSEPNKASSVQPHNPFDNIKAFQKNASKRWIEGLKDITDKVTTETNNFVTEAFGKDEKKTTSSIIEDDVPVEPTIQNMMWKKSRSSNTWEKCKIALVDNTLFYYPTVNSTQPSETFSLFLQEQQALVSIKPFISSTYSSPTPFGLTLQQPPQYQKEEWCLCFDCYKDMKLWCDTLINLVVDVSISKHVGNWTRDQDESKAEKETIEKKESISVLQSQESKLIEEENTSSTKEESSINLINWNILLSCSNISLLLSSYCSGNSTFFYFIFILLNIIATSLRLYCDTFYSLTKPILTLFGIIESEKPIEEEAVEEKETTKKEKKISLPLQPGFSAIPYSEDIAEEDKHKAQFMIPPSNLYQVRRHDYLKSKIKIPSMDSLYYLWKVDLLRCNKRVDHFSSHLELPEEIVASAAGNKWTAPEIFMISLNLPTDPPTLTGSSDDLKGFILVCYFRMKESTKEILRKQYSSESPENEPTNEDESDSSDPDKSIVNAVKLLDEWCKRSPTDAGFQSRFKLIPHGFNLEELGVPSYLCKYNDKPLLIKRQNITGFYRQSHNMILHSFDITFYPFPYIAKQAISYMYSSYKDKLDLGFAFVLEGRNASELPEVILGSVRLKEQDFSKLEKYEDYVDE